LVDALIDELADDCSPAAFIVYLWDYLHLESHPVTVAIIFLTGSIELNRWTGSIELNRGTFLKCFYIHTKKFKIQKNWFRWLCGTQHHQVCEFIVYFSLLVKASDVYLIQVKRLKTIESADLSKSPIHPTRSLERRHCRCLIRSSHFLGALQSCHIEILYFEDICPGFNLWI
jgi:hypothetical protein